jgi:DegV family protein with EDD domain
VRDHAAATLRAAASFRSAKIAAEAARLLIVVDAGCDMPTAWLHNNSIAVVPVDVYHGDQKTRDYRDEVQCGEFVLGLRGARMPLLRAEPPSPVQIRDHLQSWMTPAVDYVLQLTFSGSRSKVHLSSLAAMQSLVLIHNKVRRSMVGRGALNAWVIDSQTGLTGLAVLLAHAVQLRDRGVAAAQIAAAMKLMRDKVHTLLVPGDLRYLRQTAQRKAGGELAGWKAALGHALGMSAVFYAGAGEVHALARVRGQARACDAALARATRHVELGLAAPTVCVSYAGDLEALIIMPAFELLYAECKRRGVELITSTMSMTGCLKLGPEALSVSFASERFLA